MGKTGSGRGKLDGIVEGKRNVPEQDPWANIQNRAAQQAAVQVEGI